MSSAEIPQCHIFARFENRAPADAILTFLETQLAVCVMAGELASAGAWAECLEDLNLYRAVAARLVSLN